MCSEGHGKLTVFSVKAMLATMCGGKIVDKLRCKYISDGVTVTHTTPTVIFICLRFRSLCFIPSKRFANERPPSCSSVKQPLGGTLESQSQSIESNIVPYLSPQIFSHRSQTQADL